MRKMLVRRGFKDDRELNNIIHYQIVTLGRIRREFQIFILSQEYSPKCESSIKETTLQSFLNSPPMEELCI